MPEKFCHPDFPVRDRKQVPLAIHTELEELCRKLNVSEKPRRGYDLNG